MLIKGAFGQEHLPYLVHWLSWLAQYQHQLFMAVGVGRLSTSVCVYLVDLFASLAPWRAGADGGVMHSSCVLQEIAPSISFC